MEAFTKIRELPRAFRNLMANPTFFFLNLAGASEGLLIAGFAAFLPKLIENQFSVNASWAALLMGTVDGNFLHTLSLSDYFNRGFFLLFPQL
jgi:organic anion transporter 4A